MLGPAADLSRCRRQICRVWWAWTWSDPAVRPRWNAHLLLNSCSRFSCRFIFQLQFWIHRREANTCRCSTGEETETDQNPQNPSGSASGLGQPQDELEYFFLVFRFVERFLGLKALENNLFYRKIRGCWLLIVIICFFISTLQWNWSGNKFIFNFFYTFCINLP